MNGQKCKSMLKRLFSEATLYKIAQAHTCISIVVLMQASIVVLTYCRMAIRVYQGIEAKKQANKQVRKRIYKSIFIHLLKDSNQ